MGDNTVTEVVGQSQSSSRVKDDRKKEKNEKRIYFELEELPSCTGRLTSLTNEKNEKNEKHMS